jgi:hypothetical protein
MLFNIKWDKTKNEILRIANQKKAYQIRERFESSNEDFDYMCLNALKSRAVALTSYLLSSRFYRNWIKNWTFMEKNLKKIDYDFKRLNETDKDVAYVINKGESIRFKIRDLKRYVPINTYQYVLYHEMAHLANYELGHGEKFKELLNLICVAAFEMGLFRLDLIHDDYLCGETEILSKSTLEAHILNGVAVLEQVNPPSMKEYYRKLKSFF